VKTRRRLSPVAAVVALLVIVELVRLPAAFASDAEDAAGFFRRGKALFAQRSYRDAIEAFRRAYELQPHFMVQCSIGHCYERLGLVVEAAAAYRRCLGEGGGSTQLAAELRERLRGVERRIARVEIAGASGAIYVDGQSAGRAPGIVSLDPGWRAIEVRRPGAPSLTKRVELRDGELRVLDIIAERVIVRSEPPRPAPRGRRRLRSGWFWASAATTIACAGATTALGVLTLRQQSSFQSQPTRASADRFYQLRTLTNVFIGLTAAAGAASTVLFFFTDFGGSRREGRTVAGLGVRGTF
jgi:hypothetical protein